MFELSRNGCNRANNVCTVFMKRKYHVASTNIFFSSVNAKISVFEKSRFFVVVAVGFFFTNLYFYLPCWF